MPKRLTEQEFFEIYSKVPRATVDLIIKGAEGILLALRSNEPNIDCWHMPGGTIRKGETLTEAAVRVAKSETGLDVKVHQCLGFMEFPHEIRNGANIHTISLVLEATPLKGELHHDKNAKKIAWFATLPQPMIAEHEKFLRERNIGS